MNAHGNWALRRIGLFTLALGAVWLLVFVYAVHIALPFNPIRLPFETSEIRAWMPEGWAFFTRNPREEHIFLFSRRGNGKWTTAALGPNARPSNEFGLNRISRAQGVETALLMNRFPNSAYLECRGLVASCLEGAQRLGTLKNPSPAPTLCGEIGIVMRKPVPWAWWASGQSVVMPSRFPRITVDCE